MVVIAGWNGRTVQTCWVSADGDKVPGTIIAHASMLKSYLGEISTGAPLGIPD